MATLRLVAALALVTACYRQDPDFYTTMPEPVVVEGPPGGEIDPAWQVGYVDDNAATSSTASGEPSADPEDPGYWTGACTDAEIDATLDGYGEWIEIDGYGRVWRPYTTVVGVHFTPYETCGSWVWTDWGWTFACEWDWGWLPFHYGRWGWFDDYWAWVPGYEYSPAWVEWRSGGGYVGWRPLAPVVRDHRDDHDAIVVRDHRHGGPRVRDHRTAKTNDWQWRFVAASDLGKPRIRAHLAKSLAEGLRVTSSVRHPPVHPHVQPVRAASIMRGRIASRFGAYRPHVPPARGTRGPARRGAFDARAGSARGLVPGRVTNAPRRPAGDAAPSVYQPVYQPPATRPATGDRAHAAPADHPTAAVYGGLPVTPTTPDPTPPPSSTLSPAQHPSSVYQPPVAQPPEHTPTTYAPPTPATTYHPPGRYTPPSRPPTSRPPSSYSPPARTYSPPPRSYSPPRSSSATPARTYSPPARSYSPPARSYSPPARSSSSRSSSFARSGGGFSGARGRRR